MPGVYRFFVLLFLREKCMLTIEMIWNVLLQEVKIAVIGNWGSG